MLYISVESKNDYNSYLKYIRYTSSKNRKGFGSAATGVLIAASLAVIAAAFFFLGPQIYLWVFLALDIACAGLYLYAFFISPRLGYRRLGDSFTAMQTFSFFDEYMELAVGGSVNKLSRIPYVCLKKVLDAPGAFYIYVAQDKALILNKSAMSRPQCEKLLRILKENGVKIG